MARAAKPQDEWVVEWPTLGFLVSDWKTRHCVIPDGFRKGEPFVESDWQLWATVNKYRVRPDAEVGQLATAFFYRRTQVVLPQKSGKGPWSASDACAQAVGPVLFAGFAEGGEKYRCSEHGCGCGWVYEYEPGEPMGQPWPTPLIQVTAFSQDQADNIWRPLQAMIRYGRLAEQLRVGEEFIRCPNDGRIDLVTSSAKSRLGNPITEAYQDEVGLWDKSSGMIAVAETQRRSLAGMGGRATETTNAWDPADNSVAQRTFTSKAKDVFRLFPQAPAHLSFLNKAERRRILRAVYAGCPWVDLDAIEAEALELMELDPAQAERFFGNRIVAAADAFLKPPEKWAELVDVKAVPAKAKVALGFDGSMYDDWTAIRGRAWIDGRWYGFTPTFADDTPTYWNPAEYGGEVPRSEVQAAVKELFERYSVTRMYCDPREWQSEIDEWSATYGAKVVVKWETNRTTQFARSLERWLTDVKTGTFAHDGCDQTFQHIKHSRRIRKPGGIVVGKPTDHQKIDLHVTDVLAHEAAADSVAAGLLKTRKRYAATA